MSKLDNSIIYIKNLVNSLNKLNFKEISLIEKTLINKIKSKNNIFICGNGGSASVSNHFVCDFNKGIKLTSKNKFIPKVISLNSNIEIISAISNDISFEKVFTFQLENLALRNDVLITMSCSGRSKNITQAIKYAKKKGLTTISLTGFATKKNQQLTDLNINIGIKNYGICEDVFQVIMHMISQNIRKKFLNNKEKKFQIL